MAERLSDHPLCLGKLIFMGPGQARKAVRNMKSFGKTVQAYRCLACGEWHVGRPPRVKNNR